MRAVKFWINMSTKTGMWSVSNVCIMRLACLLSPWWCAALKITDRFKITPMLLWFWKWDWILMCIKQIEGMLAWRLVEGDWLKTCCKICTNWETVPMTVKQFYFTLIDKQLKDEWGALNPTADLLSQTYYQYNLTKLWIWSGILSPTFDTHFK